MRCALLPAETILHDPPATQPGLIRAIGRWDLAAILVNATVGAGILGLPGRAYALLGPYSLVALLIGGLLIGLVGASYAEASSRFARSGGSYLYIHAAFGPAFGFLAGWTAMATRLLSYAAICNLAIGYAAGLWAPMATEPWRLIAITVLTGGLCALVLAGVLLSTVANNLFTLCKLAVLTGFVAIGLPALAGLHPQPFPPAVPENWSACVMLLLFGLIGLESVVINAGEMRDPRRDPPFALAAGLGGVVLLYSLVILVCMAAVPDLAHSQRPIFDGMVARLGPAGGTVFAIGAIATMTGTLFTIVYLAPRQLLAMAENRQMPAVLGRIHPRFRTPHFSVLTTFLLAWSVTVASTFMGALAATTITRLLLYAGVACAAIALRRSGKSETPSPLKLPGGTVIAAAAAGGCVWVIAHAAWADVVGVAVALGPAALIIAIRARPRPAAAR